MFKHTEETKKKLSEDRKKFLKDNPDKHPWKNKDKFKSIPCELFKKYLTDNNISFVEEYSPIDSNNYSVDIAFPDKKIAIEINGNQHYDKSGNLKQYYQDRHDKIEKEGWKLYEYSYHVVYNKDQVNEIILSLKTNHDLKEYDYSSYILTVKEKMRCKICDKIINNQYNICRKCLSDKSITDPVKVAIIKKTKEDHPVYNAPHKKKFEVTKDELERLINDYSYEKIGVMFGVTGKAIVKRAICLGIVLPKREIGYWAKKYANP